MNRERWSHRRWSPGRSMLIAATAAAYAVTPHYKRNKLRLRWSAAVDAIARGTTLAHLLARQPH